MKNARLMKWTDLLVALGICVLIGTYALAQFADSEEIANRVKCASNLRQIGQAMLLYSNDNRGSFPRTIYDPANPTPTWGTPYEGNEKLVKEVTDKTPADPFSDKKYDAMPKPNDVTAALWLLMRTEDITSEVFVCPSAGQDKSVFGGGTRNAMNWTNFAGKAEIAAHLSYSLQNPYPTKDAVAKGWKFNNTLGAEVALAGDMNPGVDALLKLTPASARDKMRKGNSPNHDFDGQNVLYGDGHVAFEPSPFAGVNQDNIYTFGSSGADVKDKGGDGIVGACVGPDDSVLLPTARDLGLLDDSGKLTELAQKMREQAGGEIKPATEQQQQATRNAIQGNFSRMQGPRKFRLSVSADKLIGSSGPVTITFNYQAKQVGENIARLELSAPDTPTSRVTVIVNSAGIEFKGNMFFEGEWKRDQKN